MFNNCKLFLIKYFNLFLIFIIFLSSIPLHSYNTKEKNSKHFIEDKVIRFHVIANSNKTYDQKLKLMVKEEINKILTPYLENVSNIEDAKITLKNLLPLIKDTAKEVVYRENYNYDINVSFSKSFFPIKSYGNITFPAGEYQAVKVIIGEGSGENWWCVMFPPLCLVDETYSVVSKDSKKKLECILTDEELRDLQNNKYKVKYKSKIYIFFRKLFKKD